MPVIPCCFPSQESERVLFIGSLNPKLFKQSINHNRAIQVSHCPHHGVEWIPCLYWLFPLDGYVGLPRLWDNGRTQGCTHRVGVVRTEATSQLQLSPSQLVRLETPQNSEGGRRAPWFFEAGAKKLKMDRQSPHFKLFGGKGRSGC